MRITPTRPARRSLPMLLIGVTAALTLTACVGGAPAPAGSASPTAKPKPTASASPRATPTPTPAVTADADGGAGHGPARPGGGGTPPNPQPNPQPQPDPAPHPEPAPTPIRCITSPTDPGIEPAAFGAIAEYSRIARPQGADCTGFRAYLSTGLPQYDSQSFEFFGHLVDTEGNVNSLALMSQGNTVIPGAETWQPTVETGALIFNRLGEHAGPNLGAMYGLAELSFPVSISYAPWRIQAGPQDSSKGLAQTIDMRVISGVVGEAGAVYRLDATLDTWLPGETEPTTPAKLTVIAKDTTGMIQWGYGPNGFFPLWMFDGTTIDTRGDGCPTATSPGCIPTTDQRSVIMNRFGGDIGAFLEATGTPMTGQGSQYYTAPLIEVQSWHIDLGGTYVTGGTEGRLILDNLTQTYDEAAQYIVKNGYSWTEFTTQIPETGQGLLVAVTSQPAVGELYYAMLGGAGSQVSANGALQPTANWPQGAIEVEPLKRSRWVSPTSCYVYDLSYHVKLAGSATRPAVDLVYTATAHEQEASGNGRSAYEGLFSYTGTLGDTPVSGYAWGEIQGVPPKAGITPPKC